jgi:Mn2+/Fe2+ NRAMP family transporter
VTALAAPTRIARYASVFGPGSVVMLADTDVGSIITAGQSGVQWGYRLLMLQFVLMPILFIVQELTVRLAIFTGRGHGELISQTFGRFWAWFSVAGLSVATMGALVTELSGVAGVGELYGVPRGLSLTLAAVALLAVVLTGSYRRVERVAIALGLFEFAFFVVAWLAHPSLAEMARGAIDIPFANKDYVYLAAANIGAVIMPWMVFYQQSAVADKGLRPEHLKAARWDTAVGAVVTQLIMAAVLVAVAATIGRAHESTPLDNVPQIAAALTPVLGDTVGRMVFALGISGAALVATIVVSLTAAWGLGEVTGYRHSLEHHPREAPWFYGIFIASLLAGGAVVMSGTSLVELSVAVNVMNSALLPIVLGFLFLLARKALPAPYRLTGWYAWVVGIVIVITASFALYAGAEGIFG